MSTSVNSALNSTINTYTYSYQNKLQAKLDKNDDASWSRDELQSYADSYAKATGKKLDVNALMEKYANEDGVIDYKSQKQMQTDDALGFSELQTLLDKANSSTSSSSSSSSSSSPSVSTSTVVQQASKDAAIQAVKQYTYDYSGKLQPLLDKNDDGMWSKDELQNYAKLYNKATGKTLDVDKLMETYGKDGVIDPSGQSAMKKADALDLAGLKTAYDAATESTAAKVGYVKPYAAYTEDTTLQKKGTTGDFTVSDLMSTMSSSGKAAFSMKVNKYESMGNMLNMMTNGYSSTSAFNIFSMSTVSATASQLSLANQMNFTA